MFKLCQLVALLVLVLLPISGFSAPLTLIYSGDFNGELEPCGCSEGGNYGGVLRRSTTLKLLRDEKPDLVAISGGQLIANESSRDRLKSEYVLRGFASFGYDAVAVRWRDLAYGVEFIEEHDIPWMASNWRNPSDKIVTSRLIEREGIKLRVFSWLNPKRSPFRQMDQSHWLSHDDLQTVKQGLKEANDRGEMTVLLTAWPLRKVKKVFDLDNVDLLMVRAAYEEYSEPQREGSTLVIQPGSRGMRLGRLDLFFVDGVISDASHQVIQMPESVNDDPALLDWYAEYNAKVKEAYLAQVEIEKALQSGQRDYVGAEQCQSCHESQFTTWQGMKHANAFSSLENVGKSFDPDCIGCHTVGFEQGGYVDFSLTPELLNVQCESCHGAGRDHIQSGGEQATPNQVMPILERCQQCHEGSHSPDFDLELYWPKIAH